MWDKKKWGNRQTRTRKYNNMFLKFTCKALTNNKPIEQ